MVCVWVGVVGGGVCGCGFVVLVRLGGWWCVDVGLGVVGLWCGEGVVL